MIGRIKGIDSSRGIAIILMVMFHFVFDLDFLGLANVDLEHGFWYFFPRAIGSMFLLLVGISLTVSDARDKKGGKEGYWHHAKRGLIFAVAATAITLATWIYPHEGFIQFGIIHLIALSTFIAPLFLRFGRLNIAMGLIVIAAGFVIGPLVIDSHYLLWLGITYPGYTALDYYPLLPWFGVVLIGIAIGQILFPDGEAKAPIPGSDSPAADALAYLGRNSLAIYLIHQVILIGALLIIKTLLLG